MRLVISAALLWAVLVLRFGKFCYDEKVVLTCRRIGALSCVYFAVTFVCFTKIAVFEGCTCY